MDILHRHRRRRRQLSLSLAAVAFILLSSVTVIASSPSPKFGVESRKLRGDAAEENMTPRRRLGGPGSSPPSCRFKCGMCVPCVPVHVPIQPGFSVPLEYYPEAWRCKCGNKLFMP